MPLWRLQERIAAAHRNRRMNVLELSASVPLWRRRRRARLGRRWIPERPLRIRPHP